MKQLSTGTMVGSLALSLLLGACGSKKASDEPAEQSDKKSAEPAEESVKEAPEAEKAAPSQEAAADKERSLLEAGVEAPDFTAKAHDGTTVKLSELRGQPVVLYFYPKDETPGCTIEAQSFRDSSDELGELDAKVIGVSADSLESHAEFADNHDLNFPLIVDPDGTIASEYGVKARGGMYERVTFLIGPDGTIAKVFPQVDPREHAGEVIAAIGALSE